MKKHRAILAPCVLATVIACTASAKWEAVCGCGPVWEMVANDLGFARSVGEEAMTPEFVAAETQKRVRGKPLTLENIRGVGPYFDSSCIRRGLIELRCTFWMWKLEDQHRGIELQFVDSANGIAAVKGRYVYDADSTRNDG